MKKILVTIYFDNEEDLELEDRDYDRFIIEAEEHNFRDRFHEVIERKRYAWDDFQKINQGYKAIMSTETSSLSDLEVFSNDNFQHSFNKNKELLESNKNIKKDFSYEKFYNYVKNKMSFIKEDENGKYKIVSDTQALQQLLPPQLGWVNEDTAIKYIYKNNLFKELEDVIKKEAGYVYDNKNFEEIANKFLDKDIEKEDIEDDWGMEI